MADDATQHAIQHAIQLDPLEELRLVARPAADRLPAMLFLAALVHGVLIMGIAFNPALSDTFGEAISLEVTIVADPDQDIDRPDDAAYLAQASQAGGGNTTEQVRPAATPASLSPFDNPGTEEGLAFVDETLHERPADELLATTRERDVDVRQDPRRDPAPEASTARALERGSDATLPLPQEDRATLLIRDEDPRQLVIAADTRESNIAVYLDNWKRRIEAVGADYFPELGELDGLTGSPTLEVSISATGELADVIIRKSSGSAVLDQAALDILRRASPFEPFPAEIQSEYDSLRFAYKWLFADELVTRAASLGDN
ncbi:MAG TPA: energy transducer TonB [Woeseiaceae bacterium]|nr:energy transducer TonB [Woeseiaceae bacterium]